MDEVDNSDRIREEQLDTAFSGIEKRIYIEEKEEVEVDVEHEQSYREREMSGMVSVMDFRAHSSVSLHDAFTISGEVNPRVVERDKEAEKDKPASVEKHTVSALDINSHSVNQSHDRLPEKRREVYNKQQLAAMDHRQLEDVILSLQNRLDKQKEKSMDVIEEVKACLQREQFLRQQTQEEVKKWKQNTFVVRQELEELKKKDET